MTARQASKRAVLSLARPTEAVIESHLQTWDTLDKYRLHDATLSLLFHQLCPSHKDVQQVLLKVSVLNDFYSTNIYNTAAMAEHIVRLDVADRIASGDASVVSGIASIAIAGKPRTFYSFASKYCSHHQPDHFPIFDSYVEAMLKHFRGVDQFASFKDKDLRDYGTFVGIIEAFRQYYALDHFTLREIDVYLWLAGKTAFGKARQPE